MCLRPHRAPARFLTENRERHATFHGVRTTARAQEHGGPWRRHPAKTLELYPERPVTYRGALSPVGNCRALQAESPKPGPSCGHFSKPLVRESLLPLQALEGKARSPAQTHERRNTRAQREQELRTPLTANYRVETAPVTKSTHNSETFWQQCPREPNQSLSKQKQNSSCKGPLPSNASGTPI